MTLLHFDSVVSYVQQSRLAKSWKLSFQIPPLFSHSLTNYHVIISHQFRSRPHLGCSLIGCQLFSSSWSFQNASSQVSRNKINIFKYTVWSIWAMMSVFKQIRRVAYGICRRAASLQVGVLQWREWTSEASCWIAKTQLSKILLITNIQCVCVCVVTSDSLSLDDPRLPKLWLEHSLLIKP